MAESFKVQTKMEKNEISVDREKGVEKKNQVNNFM